MSPVHPPTLTFRSETLGDGLTRVPAGTSTARLFSTNPAYGPLFFGPPLGMVGRNRFDVVGPRTRPQQGILYIGRTLLGAYLEVVQRGRAPGIVSRKTLSAQHRVTSVTLTRDLVCIDLIEGLAAMQIQMANVIAPPSTGPLAYPATNAYATLWEYWARSRTFPNHPGREIDGILYVSRNRPSEQCLALWESAESALAHGPFHLLGDDPAIDDVTRWAQDTLF